MHFRQYTTVGLCLLFIFSTSLSLRADDGKNTILATTAYLSGNLLFTTYTLIGTINDTYVLNSLGKEISVTMLEEQINLMNGAAEQYQKVMDSDFLTNEADLISIQDFLRCSQLLKKEAEELRKLISSNYVLSAERYLDARDKAWKVVKSILQLSD